MPNLKPQVVLVIGVALAVVQAVQYLLLLPTWAHILISTIVAVLALYHLAPATPAQILAAIPPQVLAVIGLLGAAFAAVLPLIAVGSVWRAVIAGVLAVLASLLPGIIQPPPAAGVQVTGTPGAQVTTGSQNG